MKINFISPFTLSLVPFAAMLAGNNTKQSTPNIVLIYSDDLGYGDLSCYGYSKVPTPNVDKLASEGLRFTNAHCGAATSTPSRYALLTGQYAWRKQGTGIATGDAAMIIKPEQATMPRMLQGMGYKTGAVGKWHLGLGAETGKQNWNGLITPGLKELGFDYSYIMAATGDRTPCVFMENGRVVNLDPADPIEVSYIKNFSGEPTGKDNPQLLRMHPSHTHNQSIVNGISRIGYMRGGKSALWTDENIADSITAKALNFIESNKNQPFFLYFGTQDVHVPRVPHPRFAGKSGLGARGDAILEFDWIVGQVMATLKKLQLDENTLVILSSDNGPVIDDGYQDQAVELLGDHKPWGPFRGGKYSGFEAGTRIPQIVRWIGKVKPAISNTLVSQLDWYASFAALTKYNIKPGEAPDSQNGLKTLLGKSKKDRQYVVKQNLNNVLSIVVGNWKYIEPSKFVSINKYTNTELANNPQPQLYNLKTDQGETINLATEYPDKVNELKIKLEKIRKSEK
ncbi:MAG: arylsulfatase [Porphyromonadaceae bacterium CG2_30_38_12]|nr:MAG: arylsulfatase [Porphyromonadaceae bacterium CG2_30_38_12]